MIDVGNQRTHWMEPSLDPIVPTPLCLRNGCPRAALGTSGAWCGECLEELRS